MMSLQSHDKANSRHTEGGGGGSDSNSSLSGVAIDPYAVLPGDVKEMLDAFLAVKEEQGADVGPERMQALAHTMIASLGPKAAASLGAELQPQPLKPLIQALHGVKGGADPIFPSKKSLATLKDELTKYMGPVGISQFRTEMEAKSRGHGF